MNKRIFSRIVFIVSINLFLLLSIVKYSSFDLSFYIENFKRNNITNETGYSMDELIYTSKTLIAYLEDDIESLDIEISNNKVFGERERLHMEDVKELFLAGYRLRYLAGILALVSGAVIIKCFKEDVGKTLKASSISAIAFILLVGGLIYLNFDSAFTVFHLILFDNDLWLLNPRTDVLIQMLPLDFFYRLTIKIFSTYIGVLFIKFILGLIFDKTMNKNPL